MTQRERKLILSLHARHGRRKTGMFVVEGLRACREALARRPDWHVLSVCDTGFSRSDSYPECRRLAQLAGGDLEIIPDAEFAGLAVTENPQGILCVFRNPELQPPGTTGDPFILILDQVADPGNMGTILRTAWAVGLHGAWLTSGCADPFGPKAIRAGMGAQFSLDLRQCSDLTAARIVLTDIGFNTLWCTLPDGGVSCYGEEFDLSHSGLVIGNEANGIANPSIGCPVSIPMPGAAESLNAAQAATIFLFEGVRRGLIRNETLPPSTEQK